MGLLDVDQWIKLHTTCICFFILQLLNYLEETKNTYSLAEKKEQTLQKLFIPPVASLSSSREILLVYVRGHGHEKCQTGNIDRWWCYAIIQLLIRKATRQQFIRIWTLLLRNYSIIWDIKHAKNNAIWEEFIRHIYIFDLKGALNLSISINETSN